MTTQDAINRITERLDEEATPVYWQLQEYIDALNYSQRFFCLLTLCIERTANFALGASTCFHNIISHAINPLADFIVPLRATVGGKRLKTATVHQLNLLDPFWTITPETAFLDLTNTLSIVPTYYAVLGCDMLAVYPQDDAGVTMRLTYAASPTELSLSSLSAELETPTQYHPCIVDFAILVLIQKQGGAEFANEIPRLKVFLEEAGRLGGEVRSRMKAQGYERVPFDLASYDRSAELLKVRLAEQPRMKAA